MHNQLSVFLENDNKFTCQKGHSCQMQVLETVNQWTCCLDRASSSHVGFPNISKAFDTVPHKCLLLKLEHIGSRGKLLDLISSYLLNHRQCVLIDGASSE